MSVLTGYDPKKNNIVSPEEKKNLNLNKVTHRMTEDVLFY